MEAANVPGFIPAPFGADASSSYIRSIPTEQPVPGNGEASFDLGFPPETFTPPSGGGFAPDGRDFNGLMNQVTALEQWYCSGGPIQWSSTYSTTIGGYAKGAVVASATTLGVFWFSTADNNVTNPDAGGAGWVRWLPAAYYGQDTGSANAYAVTFPIPYVTRIAGAVLYVKIANTNTGASTLTPGAGLGASIIQANGTPLVANQLVAGMIATFIDNGTYYQLVNPSRQASALLNVQVFGTPGSFVYTPTPGATSIIVDVVGGGGGGSNCETSSGSSGDQSGGGGGAGGYCRSRVVLSGGTISGSVGGGGTYQTNGGASTFGSMTANGGEGSVFSSGQSSAGGEGGTSSGGNIWNFQGQWGSDGQELTLVFAGNGANGPWGGGGRAGEHAGASGGASGAGGGGAYDAGSTGTTYYGGAGANGVVVVYEFSEGG